MNARPFRATAPVALGTLTLASCAVSALIVFGDFPAAPRFWGVLALSGVGVISAWQAARRTTITLRDLDQWAWAVLICHTVVVARIRDPRALAEEGSLTTEIIAEMAIWCVCLGYGIARLLQNLPRLKNLVGPGARYAVLLFISAMISVSYAASPAITFAWSMKLLAILVLAAVLFDPNEPAASADAFMAATYWGLLLMLLQFVILGMLSPQAALQRSPLTGIWRAGGYLLPATQLSTVGGMVAALTLIDILAGRPRRHAKLVLAGSVGLMLSSLGRSGMLATAVAIILVLVLFRRMRLAVLLTAVASFVMTAAPGLLDLSWEILSRRQTEGELVSLTGRVKLWEKTVELVSMKPWLGWGYVSGSRVALLEAFQWWPAPHAHNAFLEILLTLGFVGIAILAALLWKTYSGTVRLLISEWAPDSPSIEGQAALKILALVLLLTIDGVFNAGFSGAPRFETSVLIGSTFCVDHLRRSWRARL